MSDQSAAMLLREILFDKDNIIDWDKAFCLIQKYMPELKVMDWTRLNIGFMERLEKIKWKILLLYQVKRKKF